VPNYNKQRDVLHIRVYIVLHNMTR